MTRDFSLGAVLSLTTGRLLCEFGDMQEFCEFLAGEPIWTHQFAHRPFVDALRAAAIQQHPRLDNPELSVMALGELILMLDQAKEESNTDRQYLITGWLSKQQLVYGESLSFSPMGAPPTNSEASFTEPLKGKDVIVVEGGK